MQRVWPYEVTDDYEIKIKYRLSKNENTELEDLAKEIRELLGTPEIMAKDILRGVIEAELLKKSHRERIEEINVLIAQTRALLARASDSSLKERRVNNENNNSKS